MTNSAYVAIAAMSVVLIGAIIFVKLSPKKPLTQYSYQNENPFQNRFSIEGYMPSVPSAVPGNVAVFDSVGNIKDSTFQFSDEKTDYSVWSGQRVSAEITDALKNQINDAITSDNTTWSSSGILNNLTAVADVLKMPLGTSGNFLNYSATGKAQDSGMFVDDAITDRKSIWSSVGTVENLIKDDTIQNSSTWSSKKLSNAFASKDEFPSKTLLIGTGDGNFTSSNIVVDDALGPASNIVWSSEKVQEKILGPNKNLIAFSDKGVVDSGFVVDDALPKSSKVLWSSLKIPEILDSSVEKTSTWSSKQIVDTIQAAANVLNQNTTVIGNAGNVAQVGTVGNVVDSGFKIDDTAPANKNVLWTSQRFQGSPNTLAGFDASGNFSSLPIDSFSLMTVSSAPTDNLLKSASGQATDSGVSISDSKGPSSNVVWTSEGVIKNLIADDSTSSTSTWSSLQISGAVVSAASKIISDTTTNSSTTWSSDKIANEIAQKTEIYDAGQSATSTWSSDKIALSISEAVKIPETTVGQILSTDSNGNPVSSGFSVNDELAASPTVIWTSDKVVAKIVPAVEGDLIVAKADGSISDSGFRIDDNLVGSKIIWSSDKISQLSKIPNVASNNSLITVSNGTFADSGFVVDDNKVGENILWSSVKNNATYLPRLAGPVGNLVASGANGTAVVTNVFVDDSAAAASSVLWSSQKMTNSFMTNTGSPNTIVSFDSSGNATSSLTLNDSSTGTGVLWSSSKIQSKLDAISQFATSYTVNDATTSASNIWTAQQVKTAIDAASTVKIAFDASSDQIVTSLNTPITYNIVSVNIGNAFNQFSGKFTAPQAGYYFFHWQGVQHDNQGLDVRVFMKLNGSTIMGTYSYQTRHNQLVMSCVRRLNANDSVWAEINQGSITSSPSDLFTKFSGFML